MQFDPNAGHLGPYWHDGQDLEAKKEVPKDDQTKALVDNILKPGRVTAAFRETVEEHHHDLTWRELLAGMEDILSDRKPVSNGDEK